MSNNEKLSPYNEELRAARSRSKEKNKDKPKLALTDIFRQIRKDKENREKTVK